MLKKLIDSARYALKGSQDRKHPDTYIEELEYQCERILPGLCLVCVLVWLPYVSIDQVNHPTQTLMPKIRIGLSFFAILLLVLQRFPLLKNWNMTLLVFLGWYVALGAATEALLSGADSAYIGGLFITIMMTALIGPLPYWMTAGFSTSVLIFFVSGILLFQISLSSPSQQYSMRDLFTVFVCSLAFGYVQHRIRKSNYTRAKEIERQKGLVEAKEAESNRLLLNILPETIANELKASGSTKPIRIEAATVMFTDFVGFTRISEKLTPEAVVDELDKCFSYFDQVTEKYHLEKLKTIGDSFMCAGGIPTANRTHAIDCCLAALEVQAFMNQMKDIKHRQGFDYWELRLGMNTGPLVAGVVGHKKFAYDVWGDTVNTASRLESSGVPGKINISLSTFEAVKHLFDCEHRGQVQAKNKGDIDMYFLNSIRSEFSMQGEGRVPNALFKQYYEALEGEH